MTGSGKTFTMAKVIEAVQKPTLVMAPNKTLAAQLASELKEFFPDNAVVYFVRYYDYYQPEAYVPSSDTFIEKDASINEKWEKLRHAATSALLSRRDCIVVASVSCIYGIGSPMDYAGMAVFVDKQKDMDRDQVIHELIDIQYDRNDYEQKRGTFPRARRCARCVPALCRPSDPHRVLGRRDRVHHRDRPRHGRGGERVRSAAHLAGLALRDHAPEDGSRAIHHPRRAARTLAAVQGGGQAAGGAASGDAHELRPEMLETMSFCSGIENYCATSTGARPASLPYTLIDYFPGRLPFCIIDESHVTVPQIRGMHEGDRSRKITLPSTASACPAAWTTVRCASTSSRIASRSSCTCRPRRATTSRRSSSSRWSRSSAPPACWIPEIIVRGSASQIDDIIDESKERRSR